MNKLAFVDIETTGLSPHSDRIIEIGILVVENNNLVAKYTSLVDPEGPVSPYITSITGIKPSDLESAPTFYQIAEDVWELLSGCTFVAHNVRFDYGFLKSEFKRLGYNFSSSHFCTAKLSRHLFPEQKRHGLDSLILRHKLKCKNRHRAFDDAKVLWDFYKIIQKKHKNLEEIIKSISKNNSWPAYIPKEDIDLIPHAPGVYIFYGANDAVLYVGKSIDLKARILSHFNADLESSKEMKLVKQVRRIETIETGGELGAFLMESKLVKKMMPLHNRQLRKTHQLTYIRTFFDDLGYKRAELTNTDEEPITSENIENVFGIFRNRSQASKELRNICEDNQLCRKLFGLEKTKDRCFGYHLKKCKGACIGEEAVNMYNLRFELAFIKLKIKKWPYEKPIVINEESETKSGRFIVDKWCLIKSEEASGYNSLEFDLDTYNILKRYLLKKENHKFVRILDKNSL